MANARGLRIATVVSLVPAFPLCLAHGIASGTTVPAVGLAPLACSAALGVFLLLRHRAAANAGSSNNVGGASGSVRKDDAEQDRENGGGEPASASSSSPAGASGHPILLFVVDSILAVALLVVLVFTWMYNSDRRHRNGDPPLVMLAAYATLPILLNFAIHSYLAVRELLHGLAVHGLIQWLAWQAVPPDCPNCNQRLRPSSLPSLPWAQTFSRVPVPSTRWITIPQWKTPAWLVPRHQGYTRLFVNDEETQYRDEPNDGDAAISGEQPEPPVVEVVGRRDRKGKSTSTAPEDEPWP